MDKPKDIYRMIGKLQCQGCFKWGKCELVAIIDTYPAQYDYQCSVCGTKGTLGKAAPQNPVDSWGSK